MFVITDCMFGKEQENNIKDLLNYVQCNGKVIGIGTGPTPLKIEDIFSLSVWSKNPFKLRDALYKLSQSPITKNVFKRFNSILDDLPKELPNMNLDNPNSCLLQQFAETEYYNPCIPYSINENAFGNDELIGDFEINSSCDPSKNDSNHGIHILVMMFYQGHKNSVDKKITVDSFVKSQLGNPLSPGEKYIEKGYQYKIVTTYKEAVEELVTGKYSLAVLATCSRGISKNPEDEKYFKSFIDAIVSFHKNGRGLNRFGENPPFNFEINEILKAIPGIIVRLDETKSDPGGGFMR